MSNISVFNRTDNVFHIKPFDVTSLYSSRDRIAAASFWSGVLMTLTIALVLLSTSSQRRGPIFVIQCVSFLLALLYNTLVQLREKLVTVSKFTMPGEMYNNKTENQMQVTCLILEHLIPLVSDTAVIFKLMAFYPARLYSPKQRLMQLAPPSILLLPRFILILVFAYYTTQLYTDTLIVPGQFVHYFQPDKIKKAALIGTIDFGMQAVFCIYASCALLGRILDFYRNLNPLNAHHLRTKLRFFMEATSMTFLPPLALSIVAAVLVHREGSDPGRKTAFRQIAGTLVNTSVIFSLLATSWSSIRSRNKEEATETKAAMALITQIYDIPDTQ